MDELSVLRLAAESCSKPSNPSVTLRQLSGTTSGNPVSVIAEVHVTSAGELLHVPISETVSVTTTLPTDKDSFGLSDEEDEEEDEDAAAEAAAAADDENDMSDCNLNVEEFLKTRFDVHVRGRFGYFHTMEKATDVLKDYSKYTGEKFAMYKKTKNFGHASLEDIWKSGHSIQFGSRPIWQGGPMLYNDGVLFLIGGNTAFQCTYGQQRKKDPERQERTRASGKKLRKVHSKKVGCPAVVKFREIIKFPEYKLNIEDGDKGFQFRMKSLRLALRESLKRDATNIKFERRIYVDFPDVCAHKGHVKGYKKKLYETIESQVDPVILNKIKSLILEGKTDTKEILKDVLTYAKKTIFSGMKVYAAIKEHRRFFPSKSQVQRYINKILYGMESSIDEEADFAYMDMGGIQETKAVKEIRSLRRDCRCLMHQVFASTYFLESELVLKQLRNNLQTLLISLLKCLDDGVRLPPLHLRNKRRDFCGGPQPLTQDAEIQADSKTHTGNAKLQSNVRVHNLVTGVTIPLQSAQPKVTLQNLLDTNLKLQKEVRKLQKATDEASSTPAVLPDLSRKRTLGGQWIITPASVLPCAQSTPARASVSQKQAGVKLLNNSQAVITSTPSNTSNVVHTYVENIDTSEETHCTPKRKRVAADSAQKKQTLQREAPQKGRPRLPKRDDIEPGSVDPKTLVQSQVGPDRILVGPFDLASVVKMGGNMNTETEQQQGKSENSESSPVIAKILHKGETPKPKVKTVVVYAGSPPKVLYPEDVFGHRSNRPKVLYPEDVFGPRPRKFIDKPDTAKHVFEDESQIENSEEPNPSDNAGELLKDEGAATDDLVSSSPNKTTMPLKRKSYILKATDKENAIPTKVSKYASRMCLFDEQDEKDTIDTNVLDCEASSPESDELTLSKTTKVYSVKANPQADVASDDDSSCYEDDTPQLAGADDHSYSEDPPGEAKASKESTSGDGCDITFVTSDASQVKASSTPRPSSVQVQYSMTEQYVSGVKRYVVKFHQKLDWMAQGELQKLVTQLIQQKKASSHSPGKDAAGDHSQCKDAIGDQSPAKDAARGQPEVSSTADSPSQP